MLSVITLALGGLAIIAIFSKSVWLLWVMLFIASALLDIFYIPDSLELKECKKQCTITTKEKNIDVYKP